MRSNFKKTAAIIASLILTIIFMPLPQPQIVKADDVKTVNVLYYGARGNDEKDDTAAIQKALNEAPGTSAFKVVIPYGKYFISSALWLKSNTILEFETGTVLCRTSSAPGTYIIAASGQSNITINNGILDGNVSNTTVSRGLLNFYNVDNVTLTGVTFRNYCGSHEAVLDGVRKARITNCVFKGFKPFTGSAQSYTAQSGSNSFWSLEALHIDFIAPSGSYGGKNISDVEVSNCLFEGVPSGVGTHHVYDGLTATNIKIHDNTFRNLYYDACHASNFKDFELYNNYLENTPSLIWSNNIKGKIYNNYVDNRSLKLSADNISKIYNFGTNMLDVNVLSGMRISNESSGSTINYTNQTDLEIYGNCLLLGNYNGSSASRICGIKVYNDCSIYAHDNVMTGIPYVGINLTGGNAELTANYVNSAYEGLYFYRTNKTIAQSNIITGVNEWGITADEAASAVITGNTVNCTEGNTDGRGVTMFECTGSSSVTGNTVTDAGNFGIYARATTLSKVDGNILAGCDHYPMAFNNASVIDSVSSNHIASCPAARAMLVYNSSRVKVFAGNEVDEGKAEDAVELRSNGTVDDLQDITEHTHSFSVTANQQAGCTAPGYTEYKCSSCGLSYRIYNNPTGHSFGSGSVSGTTKTFTCSVNGSHKHSEYTGPQTKEPSVSANPARIDFYDTKPGMVAAGAYAAINWAVDNGIIVGYRDFTFRPTNSCTRSQFVTILWRMAGRPSARSNAKSFSDVNSSMSAYKAIRWAASKGIIVGYKDGTFRPNNPLTRTQIVVILWRMLGRPSAGSYSNTFPDVNSGMSAYNAIRWAAKESIVNGYKNGKFGSQDNCTRAQIVTILYRCVVKKGIRFS